MQEIQVQSLGQEDALGMGTHSSILAWKIPWTEEPGRLQSAGLQRAGRDWATTSLLLLKDKWDFMASDRRYKPGAVRFGGRPRKAVGKAWCVWA